MKGSIDYIQKEIRKTEKEYSNFPASANDINIHRNALSLLPNLIALRELLKRMEYKLSRVKR